jgi:hypothetical protein
VQRFIDEHEYIQDPIVPLPTAIERSIGKESLIRMVEGKLATAVALERNNDVREYIHQSNKHEDLKELKGF